MHRKSPSPPLLPRGPRLRPSRCAQHRAQLGLDIDRVGNGGNSFGREVDPFDFALGGDDYVAKPFSLDEVLERIRAVLRRTRRAAAPTRLRVADLELDDDSHEVRRDGTLIALTPTEFRLLRFLMLNAGRVLGKGQILDHVWGCNPVGDGNVVEPCVSYLRRKVDQGEPRLIHTIRGVGYVLRIPPP